MTPGTKIDHSARKHALLSASGSDRWMNCTPSPLLESEFENISSNYGDEGTLAHEFAELNLKEQLKLIDQKTYKELVEPFRKHHLYTDEMEDEVQKHVDYVIQQFTEAKRKTPDAVLMIEEKVDLTEFIEEGFGTCDDTIIADEVLEVIDLKYGKGVRVSAKDNSQLKLYGLGALSAAELFYDIKTVRLTIVQPRLDSISSWEISAEDLRIWGEEVVRPKAEMAYAGEGELSAGSWCRFCRAKSRCPKIAEVGLAVARMEFSDPIDSEKKSEFKDPRLLTDEQVIENYLLFPIVNDWMKGVSDYVLQEALAGRKWPEHKLVQGRSNRAWSNQDEAIKILNKKRYKKGEYMSEPKLLGIGAIEKLVGKGNFESIMGPVVSKPEGKPTLAHESDKRPEYFLQDASFDFEEPLEDSLE